MSCLVEFVAEEAVVTGRAAALYASTICNLSSCRGPFCPGFRIGGVGNMGEPESWDPRSDDDDLFVSAKLRPVLIICARAVKPGC